MTNKTLIPATERAPSFDVEVKQFDGDLDGAYLYRVVELATGDEVLSGVRVETNEKLAWKFFEKLDRRFNRRHGKAWKQIIENARKGRAA